MVNDLRYGLRMLLKDPGFSAVAVLSLSLGIGANTAIFSLIDAVLLKMLPVRNPEQLFQVTLTPGAFSYPAFVQFRDGSQAFSGMFAFASPGRIDVSVNGQPELAEGLLVSGNFFSGPDASNLIPVWEELWKLCGKTSATAYACSRKALASRRRWC
jgi:hypothetical protein